MMKTRSKVMLASLLSLGMAEAAGEISYMFDTIFAKGNKLDLAKCTDLKTEEKIVEEDNKNESKKREQWERNSQNYSFYVKGYDGTPLYCKVYAQKNICNKWVLVVHGYGGDGSTLIYASKKFHDKGYNVVVPDLRAHGKSGGKYIGMGQLDSRDIMRILHLIIKGNPKAEIYMYGVSMGGAAVLMAASERLPENVKAVISDCSFDNADNIISYELKESFSLPSFPLVPIMDMLCRKRAKYDLRLASPVDRVEYIKIPALFIHGDNDRLVPAKMTYNLYKKAKCKKALMIIRGAGHGVSALVDKKRYWKGVFNFMDRFAKV